MISRLGRFCHRYRWIVLVAWLAGVVAGGLAAGPVFESMSNTNQLRGTESGTAREVLRAGSDRRTEIVALVEGVSPTASMTVDALARASAEVKAIAGVTAVGTPIAATDGRGVALRVTLVDDDPTTDPAVRQVSARLRALPADLPGSTVELGGDALLGDEINDVVAADLNSAEFSSLPLTMLVLIFVFGGLVAAGVPLLATMATVAGSFGVLLGFSKFVDLDSNIISVVTMLSLGLSIDYSLLLVARYREELAAGHAGPEAVGRAWATAGRTIVFSALTVAAALVGLLFFNVPQLQAMGAAGISAAVMALLSAMTLTAALLGVAGRRIKPARRTPGHVLQQGVASDGSNGHGLLQSVTGGAAERGLFARLARFTQRRAVAVTLATVALLVAAGAPLLTATVKLPQLEGIPRSIESVRVADSLTQRYGMTARPAVTVVARTDPATLDAWAARWRGDGEVERVEAARAVGPGLATIVLGVRSGSQSAEARALVDRIRADRPAGVDSWVTGEAAVLTDLRGKLGDRLPAAVAVVVIAMFVLLFLMTGSLIVPIKALLMNVVSLGATFGVLVAVFEHGVLAGPLDTLTVGGLSPFVIVLVSAFGFGLAMDYEVFLLGRIKEYVDAGHDNDAAVQMGLQRSGRLITSAALLMLIVFGFFAAARIGDLEQIGLGLFVAVGVDATIVRCLLVPATMTLLGRWNWWAPRPLRRLHARFGFRETGSVTATTEKALEPVTAVT